MATVAASARTVPQMRMRSLFRLDRDQTMSSLPFLIRILPVCYLKEEVVIGRRLVIVAQMVVGSGAQKITNWNFGQILGAHVERLDRESVILRLVRSEGQIPIGRSHIRLELHGSHKFLYGSGKLLLLHQR